MINNLPSIQALFGILIKDWELISPILPRGVVLVPLYSTEACCVIAIFFAWNGENEPQLDHAELSRVDHAARVYMYFRILSDLSLFLVCIKLAPWPEARWLVNRCRICGKVQLNPAISMELFRETKNSSRWRGLQIGASKWLKRHIQKELFWNVNNRDISGLAIARFKCNIFPGKLTVWMNRCIMEQSC